LKPISLSHQAFYFVTRNSAFKIPFSHSKTSPCVLLAQGEPQQFHGVFGHYFSFLKKRFNVFSGFKLLVFWKGRAQGCCVKN
jgi:hypothetical protein